MAIKLTHDGIDMEGVQVLESLYSKRTDRDAVMIMALCKSLTQSIREVANLREYMESRATETKRYKRQPYLPHVPKQ